VKRRSILAAKPAVAGSGDTRHDSRFTRDGIDAGGLFQDPAGERSLMRALIALDWSEQAFAAVREVSYLYDLHEVILVHGIDLGMF